MKLALGATVWSLQLAFLIVVTIGTGLIWLVGDIVRVTRAHLAANEERGKTYVRAYYFLEALASEEFDAAGANDMADTLFQPCRAQEADIQVIRRAMEYAKRYHGGNQLPVIEEAQAGGFRTDST